MKPYYQDDLVTLWHCDALAMLAELPDSSVDSVVTDPPYGLEFMGKGWDAPWKSADNGVHAEARTRRADEMGDESKRRFIASSVNAYAAGRPFQDWCEQWTAECFRVLKSGGHLLAFGGTRTWHRLACAVEDAGFEVRDSIAWLYGSGFPKSLDVSKAIDKAAGAEREDVYQDKPGVTNNTAFGKGLGVGLVERRPATDDARTWQGWGTALKPAFEPIVVARKPLIGTVAANVLAHGTGALNIDGCRVESGGDYHGLNVTQGMSGDPSSYTGPRSEPSKFTPAAGRWPANVVLDGSQAAALDEQSGEDTSRPQGRPSVGTVKPTDSTDFSGVNSGVGYTDHGGASRFFPTFRYEAKAPATERPFYYRPTCECEDAWPTHTPSAVRATDGTTAPASLSTSKSGSATTGDLSPTATRSTTSTVTSSTTTPTTSSPSPRPTTSASTPAANSETATGGSRAAFAASSSPLAPVTGTSAVRGGHSTDDAAPATSQGWSATSVCGECGAPTRREAHATVKPLDLMRWLVRLVTPPGGTVLEPFAGSGTTVEACIIEGFRCIASEREADYLPLIEYRIARRRDPVKAFKITGDDGGMFDLLDGEPA